MRLRFLEDKAFSRDGVTVIRVASGEEAEVPPRLAARYLEEGVAVAPGVKAHTAAPENKGAVVPDEPVAAPTRARRARGKAGG